MKNLILLLTQYSAKKIKEIILIFQVVVLSVVGFNSSIQLIDTYRFNKCSESVYSSNVVLLNIHSRIIKIIEGFAGFDVQEGERLNADIRETINSLNGIIGVGEIGEITYKDNNLQPQSGIVYNSDLINNTNVELEKGMWKDLLSFDGAIPVIVSKKNKLGLNMNDELFKDLFYFSSDSQKVKIKVVGVLSDNSIIPKMTEGGTEPPSTDYILGKAKNDDMIIFNSDHLTQYNCFMLTSKIIFLASDSSNDFISEYADEFYPYGTITSMKNMINQQWIKSMLLNNKDIIIFISVALQLLFSVIGYVVLEFKLQENQIGIHILCGMSKNKFIILKSFSVFLIWVVSILISVPICYNICHDAFYLFMFYIIEIVFLSIISALTVLVLTYLISKLSVSDLLKEKII